MRGKSNLLLSIITPTYNSEKTIEDTIVSVVGQRYDNLQYIIVDGLSADKTAEIVDKYRSCIDVFISEKDDGIYDAFNKGIQYATGDVVGIINSDDWYEDGIFHEVMAKFCDSDVEVVFGDLTLVFEDKTIVRKEKGCWDGLSRRMSINHPTVFVRREVYERYKYNTTYALAADYELFFKLYLDNSKWFYVNKNIAFMRLGGASAYDSSFVERLKIHWEYLGFNKVLVLDVAEISVAKFRKWRNVLLGKLLGGDKFKRIQRTRLAKKYADKR